MTLQHLRMLANKTILPRRIMVQPEAEWHASPKHVLDPRNSYDLVLIRDKNWSIGVPRKWLPDALETWLNEWEWMIDCDEEVIVALSYNAALQWMHDQIAART